MRERSIEFAGQALLLLSEGALFCPVQRHLLVADVHLGKADSFRRRGMAVPAGNSATDLQRLSALIRHFQPEALRVLGDWTHGKPSARLIKLITDWRTTHRDVALELIHGNHDRHLSSIPAGWDATSESDGQLGDIRLRHEPGNQCEYAEIVGHLHPVFALRTGRSDRLRMRVFWQRPRSLVMPSFGQFTGGQQIQPGDADRLYAIGAGHIQAITPAASGIQ